MEILILVFYQMITREQERENRNNRAKSVMQDSLQRGHDSINVCYDRKSPYSHINLHSAASKTLKRTVLTMNSSFDGDCYDIRDKREKRIQMERSELVGDFRAHGSNYFNADDTHSDASDALIN